jgi:hypothetical protein
MSTGRREQARSNVNQLPWYLSCCFWYTAVLTDVVRYGLCVNIMDVYWSVAWPCILWHTRIWTSLIRWCKHYWRYYKFNLSANVRNVRKGMGFTNDWSSYLGGSGGRNTGTISVNGRSNLNLKLDSITISVSWPNLTTKIITLWEVFNFVSEVSRLLYEWSSDCWCWRNVFSFHWRSVFCMSKPGPQEH